MYVCQIINLYREFVEVALLSLASLSLTVPFKVVTLWVGRLRNVQKIRLFLGAHIYVRPFALLWLVGLLVWLSEFSKWVGSCTLSFSCQYFASKISWPFQWRLSYKIFTKQESSLHSGSMAKVFTQFCSTHNCSGFIVTATDHYSVLSWSKV